MIYMVIFLYSTGANNFIFFHSKKLDFSDDEDQFNEKSNKQSLNGDIRSKSDIGKGFLSNKIANCDPSLVQKV